MKGKSLHVQKDGCLTLSQWEEAWCLSQG